MQLHDYKQTHSALCYEHHGCLIAAVGPGWNGLVAELMDDLEAARKHQKEPLLIDDIREECGSLDVLVSWCTPETEAMLDDYRERSRQICKCCGSTGNRPAEGYYVAKGLCRKCLSN